jgi:AcrR family transcriptional regulator
MHLTQTAVLSDILYGYKDAKLDIQPSFVNVINVSDDRKQQIIDVTRRLLAEEGLAGVNMRRIAEEVGVTTPALYRHFENQNALVRAVIEQAGQLFASYLFRALEQPSPADQLAATGEQYLRFALERRAEFDLMFGLWGESAPADLGIPTQECNVSPSFQFLIDRVAACAPGTPRAALMELAIERWALVHGLAMLYLHAGAGWAMGREQYLAMCSRIVRRSVDYLVRTEDKREATEPNEPDDRQ